MRVRTSTRLALTPPLRLRRSRQLDRRRRRRDPGARGPARSPRRRVGRRGRRHAPRRRGAPPAEELVRGGGHRPRRGAGRNGHRGAGPARFRPFSVASPRPDPCADCRPGLGLVVRVGVRLGRPRERGPDPPGPVFDDMVARGGGVGVRALHAVADPADDRPDRAGAVGGRGPGATVARPGGVLVLVPSVGWAERLCGRLVRRGYRATTDSAAARSSVRPIARREPGRGLGAASRVVGRTSCSNCPRRSPTGRRVLPAWTAWSTSSPNGPDGPPSPCIVTSPRPPTVLSAGRNAGRPSPRARRERGLAGRRVRRPHAAPTPAPASSPTSSCAWPARCSTTRSLTDRAGAAGLLLRSDRAGRVFSPASPAASWLRAPASGAAVAQDGTGLRCPRCLHSAFGDCGNDFGIFGKRSNLAGSAGTRCSRDKYRNSPRSDAILRRIVVGFCSLS